MEPKKRKKTEKETADISLEDDGSGMPEGKINFQPAKFDHKKIPLDVFGILIGKRRRGKTVYLEWLMEEMQDYYASGAYVFTKTKNNYFWQQHVPEERIYEGFQGAVIKSIIEEQRKKCGMMRERLSETDPIEECPYLLLILDDIIGDTHLNWEEELRDLAFAGRHFKLAVWITSQDCKGLGPGIRSQADILGLSYTTSKRVMDAVKEDYAYLFEEPRLIPRLIKENTMDHKFLIIDQSEAHYKAEEMFFWDQAPDPKSSSATPAFKIGTDKFWEEAGCDWDLQMKRFKNMPELDKEEWLKIAQKQLKEEKRDLDNDQDDFVHNTIGMASKEQKESWKQKFIAKYDYMPNSKDKVSDFFAKQHKGFKPVRGAY